VNTTIYPDYSTLSELKRGRNIGALQALMDAEPKPR
jgi:hypothetical protein